MCQTLMIHINVMRGYLNRVFLEWILIISSLDALENIWNSISNSSLVWIVAKNR